MIPIPALNNYAAVPAILPLLDIYRFGALHDGSGSTVSSAAGASLIHQTVHAVLNHKR